MFCKNIFHLIIKYLEKYINFLRLNIIFPKAVFANLLVPGRSPLLYPKIDLARNINDNGFYKGRSMRGGL